MFMKDSRLYIFGPLLEFSAFLRFNSFIHRIKQDKDIKITAIVVESAIDIIQDADDIITISNNYLKKTNSNYPNNLELLGNRNNSDFFKLALNYIKKIGVDNENILYWHPLSIVDANKNPRFPELLLTNGFSSDTNQIGEAYDRDYHFIKEWLSKGNTIKPTKKNFNTIKNKYGHLFNDRTFTLITRNFKTKQPETNTHVMIPNLGDIINKLTKNGVNIINIGFPPYNFDIKTNYVELNEELSQGDLISLFYLSQGTILSGANGGYNPHAASNIDVFNIKEEFRGNYFMSGRKPNKTIKSYDIQDIVKNNNVDEVMNIIKSHKKHSKLEFSEQKKIIFLDKLLNI
jgi:hypothetical protein